MSSDHSGWHLRAGIVLYRCLATKISWLFKYQAAHSVVFTLHNLEYNSVCGSRPSDTWHTRHVQYKTHARGKKQSVLMYLNSTDFIYSVLKLLSKSIYPIHF